MQNIGEGISNSAKSLLSVHQQQQQINLQTTKQEADIVTGKHRDWETVSQSR